MKDGHNKETKFRFKEFEMDNSRSAMKISTDSILLGCWADIENVGSAIDIGSGTGLLSLMLAQRGVRKVTGVEVDTTAYEESLGNAKSSPWFSSISIINADITSFDIGKYDMIISNPPYFDVKTSGIASPHPKRNLARHESTLTYSWLIENARNILPTDRGRLCFISPSDREEEITFHALINHFRIVRKCHILPSPKKPSKRILWDLRIGFSGKPSDETLCIRDINGEFNREYIDLTKDFYVKF